MNAIRPVLHNVDNIVRYLSKEQKTISNDITIALDVGKDCPPHLEAIDKLLDSIQDDLIKARQTLKVLDKYYE